MCACRGKPDASLDRVVPLEAEFGDVFGSIKVIDECSDPGEVMSIESQGDRAPFCWNKEMGLRMKR